MLSQVPIHVHVHDLRFTIHDFRRHALALRTVVNNARPVFLLLFRWFRIVRLLPQLFDSFTTAQTRQVSAPEDEVAGTVLTSGLIDQAGVLSHAFAFRIRSSRRMLISSPRLSA